MYLCVESAAFSLRRNHFSVFRNLLKSSACIALVLASASTATLADAGEYFKADGSMTNDLEAAAESWRTPEFLKNRALAGVKAEYAYAYGITGKGIRIGMVDSGVFAGHPELAGQFTPLTVEGTYERDGYRYERGNAGQWSWKKGESFSVPGHYDPQINDSHGTMTAGGIVALRDGKQTHGIAFGAHLYSVNTGGTDRTLAGPSLDYEYFRKAYAAASSDGIRAVNSSWGGESPFLQKYGEAAEMAQSRAHSSGKKTYLDAIAEAARQYGTTQVWANGNYGKSNPDIPASLPYFRPDLEESWIAVTGSDSASKSLFNRCGIAKYWCMAGPATDIYSVSVERNGNRFDRGHGAPGDKITPSFVPEYKGTAAAAAHVTGALALVMQRFPYLDNSQARDVLLTTATHLTIDSGIKSNPGIPDTIFGWGKPDLHKAMAGPGQFLGRFNVQMGAGVNDIWSNDISDVALVQRRKEEQAVVESWAARKAELQGKLQTAPDKSEPSAQYIADLSHAKDLLKAVLKANLEAGYNEQKFEKALTDLRNDTTGKELLKLYEAWWPGWEKDYSLPDNFDGFIAGRSNSLLAADVLNPDRADILSANALITAEIDFNDNVRIPHLAAKPDDPEAYLGGLTKLGDGQLTLTGRNSYRGDTLINGGELVIGRKGSITSPAFVNAGGLFTVEGRAATTVVNKNGRLNVTAAGTTGDVGITGGHAVVNGKSGRINVSGAGIVSGTGTLGGLVVQSGGIVSPGNSVGMLKVAGDAVFEKDSIFNVEIKADTGAADQLAVSGKAKLLGGVVNLRLENDPALLPEDAGKSLFLQHFDILTAGKGVHGRFSGVWPRYNYITPVLDYTDPGKVVLGFDFTPEVKTAKAEELARQLAAAEAAKQRGAAEEVVQRAALLAAAQTEKKRLEAELLQARIDGFLSPEFLAAGVKTRNQKSAWNGVQSLGTGNNPMIEQVIHSIMGNPLNFDALSGEIHATLAGVLAGDGHFIGDAATARLRNAFGGVAGKTEPAATALWGEAYGSWQHANSSSNAAGYSRDTGGIVTGIDGIVADTWRLGVLAGYGNTSLHGNGKASIDSYQIGVYGGTKWDAIGLRFGASLARHEIETKRTALFGNLSSGHKASYHGNSVQVFGELGYEISTAHAALEPFAAARHVHLETSGFEEGGRTSNLTGKASSTDLTVTTLGLRASQRIALSENTTLTARGMLGWNHAFGDVTPQSRLAFTGGQGFTVEGLALAEDAAIVEAGFGIGLGKAATLGLAYNGQFSSRGNGNTVKADLSVRF